MLAYINGEITYKTPTHVYIEYNGVAYFVHITLNTFSQLENEKHAKLFTHLVVREDAHILFGFISEEEKNMFLYLISVSGIGPNTARLVLSSLSVQEFQKAIIQGDVRLIQSIKGIGPKSAQRLILELKDKLKKEPIAESIEHISTNQHVAVMNEEALAALTMLGFQKSQAEKAIAKAYNEKSNLQSVEELIKLSLKNL